MWKRILLVELIVWALIVGFGAATGWLGGHPELANLVLVVLTVLWICLVIAFCVIALTVPRHRG